MGGVGIGVEVGVGGGWMESERGLWGRDRLVGVNRIFAVSSPPPFA